MRQSQKKNSSATLSQESKTNSRASTRPPAPAPVQWVTVQLSSQGEREKNLAVITKAVHQILRSPIEVFIPAISQKVREESETLFYMEGYIFIKHVPDVQYFKLQDTTYFATVITKPVMVNGRRQNQYNLVPDSTLDPMRSGMQELRVVPFKTRDRVRVIKGSFKNMPGVIVDMQDDDQVAQVDLDTLRSKKLQISFPVTYLVKTEDIG